MEETGGPEENQWHVANHWETLSSTPHLSGIWTDNVSGDMHWLHRLL
jgi:hypothetical protein